MTRNGRIALAGFAFGTLGLYALAALALAVPPIEYLAGPLFAPSRWLAGWLTETSGRNPTTFELTLFNGSLYAFVFVAISRLVEALRQR